MKQITSVLIFCLIIAALTGCNKSKSPSAPAPDQTHTASPTFTISATFTNTATITPTVSVTPTVTATPTITSVGTPWINASLRVGSDASVSVKVDNAPAPDATVVVVNLDASESYYLPYTGTDSYSRSKYYSTSFSMYPETNYRVDVTIGGMTFSATGETPSVPHMAADGLSVTFGAIHPSLDCYIYDPDGLVALSSTNNVNPSSPFDISPAIYTKSGAYSSICYMIYGAYEGATIFPGTDTDSYLDMESIGTSNYVK